MVGHIYVGRQMILCQETEITHQNVRSVLSAAMRVHQSNRAEIDYLYWYMRGKQPVLQRTKRVRPEINNTIVENHANEIVAFKTGYLCGEPIQYVGKNGDKAVTSAITQLNDMMAYENKDAADHALVEWGMICGTGYRMVLPDEAINKDDAPFEIYTLDPRNTFVVYNNAIGNKPLMAVTYTVNPLTISTPQTYSVYTSTHYYEIADSRLVRAEPHALGAIPIIEYPANNARLGAFEIVLGLLDAINNVASNRMDGVEQFVQSFFKFINCDIEEDEFDTFREKGAIKITSLDGQTAEVDLITNELNQDQTQTFKNDLIQNILVICGMPNRNGGSSTSDTGAAVIMRDGWEAAEARAKDSEVMFKASEREFLKLVFRICKDMRGMALALSQVDIAFTRRNYEAIQSKSQVLVQMLQQPTIHPRLAFKHCGMFSDPESAYKMSAEWAAEQIAQAEKNAQKTELSSETDAQNTSSPKDIRS